MKKIVPTIAMTALVAVLIYASTTPPSGAVVESHENTDSSVRVGLYSTTHYTPAQQFYLDGTGTTLVSGIGVYIKGDWGSPTDELTLTLFTNGEGNEPKDPVAGTAKSFTPVTESWNYVTFEGGVSLSNGEDNTYWIVASFPVQTVSNGYTIYRSNSSTYTKGLFKWQRSSDPGVWDTESQDISFQIYSDASLPVSGVSHACAARDGVVKLSWTTVSELGTLGFHVSRAQEGSDDFRRITHDLILAQGSPSSGGDYVFLDKTLDRPGVYLYRIHEVHGQGETVIAGPLRVAMERGGWSPETCTLEGAYPNPFNPGTLLRYSVAPEAEGEAVRLAVFNLRGQTVRVMEGGMARTGKQAMRWDGRDASGGDLPSGIYFCRMTLNGEPAGVVKLIKAE